MSRVFFHLEDLENLLRKVKPSNICLVTSRLVANKLRWVIRALKISESQIIYIPDGESAKTWKSLEKLLISFSDKKLDRSSLVLVLGGGTVGDLVGFACSIYLRGINYVQIPTTLLAQVDSAHGGKTGIDFLSYKNNIGSIYQAKAVIVDIRVLKSLGDNQIIDGLGEIIKCGLIKDKNILALLNAKNGSEVLSIRNILKDKNLKALINRTINVKDYYTKNDLNDFNKRQILNFGHTYGHAIELAHGLSHGYSVILGMICELRLAESLDLTDPSVRLNLLSLLQRLGINIDNKIEEKYKPDIKSIYHDKKISGATIALPVVRKAGQSELVNVPISKLIKFIQK